MLSNQLESAVNYEVKLSHPLLSHVWTSDPANKVGVAALRVWELLPRFWGAPKILELLPGFWSQILKFIRPFDEKYFKKYTLKQKI